jgi:hypothetical protein
MQTNCYCWSEMNCLNHSEQLLYIILFLNHNWSGQEGAHLIRAAEDFMGVQGAEFVIPFFSGSRSLALKSSSKSHQMTNYLIKTDEVFTKMKSLFSQYSFWMRKVIIWWLFIDNLRARGREPEKKETTNSAPKSSKKLLFQKEY